MCISAKSGAEQDWLVVHRFEMLSSTQISLWSRLALKTLGMYIFKISCLSVVSFAIIFSHSEGCLFTLLILCCHL